MNRWAKYGIVAVVALAALYITRGILAPFVLAIVTAYIVSPLVDRAQRISRLPRALIVVIFYLVFIGALTALGVLLEPELARQTTGQNGLFASGGTVADAVLDRVSKNDQIVDVLRRAGVDIVPYDDPSYPAKKAIVARRLQLEIDRATQPSQVREVAQTTFSILLKVVIWFFATFYLLLNGRNCVNYLYRFVPDDRVERVAGIMARIHYVMGRYLRGQLYLILIMSVVSYIALTILKVPYALPIAIGTGILEIVPFVGPIIAGTIASLVALSTQGVGTMIAVILAYFILRELEDQIIIPQVIGRVVHLDPVVTIFVVLAGDRIAGIVGVLLAVPLAAAVRVIIDELFPAKTLSPAPVTAGADEAVMGVPERPQQPRTAATPRPRRFRRPVTPPTTPSPADE